EQHGVAGGVRGAPWESVERAAKLSEQLGGAPRQRAVPFQRDEPELLDGRAILARQGSKRVSTVFGDPEIHEVIRIVLPAHNSPEVRVRDTNNNLLAVISIESLELSRQQLERAAHDVLMRRETPREGRRGQDRDD